MRTTTATMAVTARVLTQVRRDHRTVAMLLVLPCVVMSLLWWMFQDLPGDGFDRLGPALLALIPFIVMFLVTSVTTLRERSSGTLERLLAMPTGKLDFLELMIVRRETVAARRGYIEALETLTAAEAELDRALGRMP